MNADDFARACVSGAHGGFYGDFLYSANQTRYGSGPVESLAGPTIGPLLELSLVQPLGAIRRRMEGKDTHLMAQTIQDLKSFMPMGNAWYAKAALDHMVFHQIMEALNPGYLTRMRRRTAKEFDQEWWYAPGDTVPERGPDLGQAVAR